MRDDDKTDLPSWLGLRSLPDFTKARWLGAALSVVVIVLFGMAVLVVFAVLGHALFDFGMDDVPRIGFGTGAVAVALIGAPFVIWRAVVAQKTVNVTEQGHITDRINTAVQGLGAEKTVKRQRKRQTGKLAYATGEDDTPDYSQPIMEEVTQPNLEVRIGAIYALERIAQDSDRDHVQIMEILCAYIRQNAPAPAEDDWPKLEMKKGEKDGPLESDWYDRLNAFREKQEAAKAKLTLREDIQTALTVIGRRRARQRRLEAGRGVEAPVPFDTPCPDYDGPDDYHDQADIDAYRKTLEAWKATLRNYKGYRLDLRDSDLRGADLFGADLKGAQLKGTFLQGAGLTGAGLTGARLRGARLQGAGLIKARLQGANLWEARLQGARLREARLQGANLFDARLQGAALSEARLQEADLKKARLQGAELWEARLQGAGLEGAHLQGAELSEARLQGAGLREARLQGARLREARLQGANLFDARLQGAALSKARLQGADLAKARLQGAELWEAQLQGARLEGAHLQGADLTCAALRGAAVRSLDCRQVPHIGAQVSDMFGDASVTPPGGHRPGHEDWPPHWAKFGLGKDFYREWRKWQADPENYTPPDPPKPDETT